jgi:uncharacterized protein YdhG (YjbR/CyaY superfamily)
MPRSAAATVEDYLAELSPERRETVSTVRDVILAHLPDGYEEMMDFGMISYVIPLSTYPITYNERSLMYAALSSQKNYCSLYLMNIYSKPELMEWFERGYRASGKRMDIGKACVRFKSVDDLPLDLVGEAIARTLVADYIELYEASRRTTKAR